MNNQLSIIHYPLHCSSKLSPLSFFPFGGSDFPVACWSLFLRKFPFKDFEKRLESRFPKAFPRTGHPRERKPRSHRSKKKFEPGRNRRERRKRNTDGTDKNGFLPLSSKPSSLLFFLPEGTYLKWESALRKGLLYVAGHPLGKNKANTVHIVLSLYVGGEAITPADKKLLQNALERAGADAYLWGN